MTLECFLHLWRFQTKTIPLEWKGHVLLRKLRCTVADIDRFSDDTAIFSQENGAIRMRESAFYSERFAVPSTRSTASATVQRSFPRKTVPLVWEGALYMEKIHEPLTISTASATVQRSFPRKTIPFEWKGAYCSEMFSEQFTISTVAATVQRSFPRKTLPLKWKGSFY